MPPTHPHNTHLQALGILLARMHSHHPERHQQFGFGLGNFPLFFFKKKQKSTTQHHPERRQQCGFGLSKFFLSQKKKVTLV
jgi:hypothetical protein